MQDIKKLIAGFRRFQTNYFDKESSLFDRLKQGQNPKTLVISCSDSRVDPAILTDSAPGELFVVRNVANLVPPYQQDTGYHGVSAALEYAVRHLEVEHILILGHSQCGGIAGLMSSECDCHPGEFIGRWVGIARPARNQIMEELSGKSGALKARACEQAAILLSIDNLLSFPWVKERVERGKLFLHGWYFDIQEGALYRYNPAGGEFELAAAPVKPAI